MNSGLKSFHWVFFLLQPFLTLIHYLINFRKPQAKNIVWAFTVFFAMSIAIGQESQNSDITRYVESLIEMSSIKWGQLYDYYLESGEIDVLTLLATFLISRFTTNGYFLVVFFGFVYGFFYSRNMWLVLNKISGNLKPAYIVLIACLFLIVPIWDLGGFRFWVATHVFVYGFLSFLFINKKKYLIWCFITPIVFHYAFIVPLLVLLIYLIIGNRIKVYFYFFLLSLIIGEINITQFNNFIETYSPEILAERSSSYRIESKVESRRSGEYIQENVWYSKYLNKFIHYPLYLLLFLTYMQINRSYLKKIKLLGLLSFVYLFYGVANIFSSIPSGGRYLSIAGLLALSFLIVFLHNYNKERVLYNISKIAIPSLLIFVIVKIRMSWYFLSATTLFGNPIIALSNIGNNISINDIIKY